MKIMFCVGNMGKGGAERVIANLSNDLIKKHDITIVTTSSNKSLYELDSKVNVVAVDNDNKKGNVIFRTIKRIKRMKEIDRTFAADLIFGFLPEPSCRVLIANFFNKKKIIISVRNDPKQEYNTFLKRLLMKILFKRANGFVFQTEDAKKFFSQKIQNRSAVIPNSLNPSFMVKPYLGERDKRIVNVGRLEKQKNQRVLIDAFYEFQKQFNDYELHIYGVGSLEEELKQYVETLHLSDKILFRGNVDNIKDEIYTAKMFVLSSDYEGMPNALIESLAMGIPSISTDCPCGGPRYLIEDNVNGVLTPVNDVQTLTKKMIDLAKNSNKCLKMSKNSKIIQDKLNPVKINQQWLDYMNEVLEK